MLTMKSPFLICVAFAIIKSLHTVPQTSFLDAYVMPFRVLRITAQNILVNKERNPSHLRSLVYNKKLQDKISDDVPFPCYLNNTRSKLVPDSVHKLRPGDIKIVGAIGDSLTAGFGLLSTNILEALLENRGLSFTGGGQGTWKEYLTLPNIFKVFNPDLLGYSLRTSLSIERASQFNVAEGGAISDNTPYMAQILVKRIKNDPRVNLHNDWKMINICIGGNDFCSEICYMDFPERALEKHKDDMIRVLRTLRDNLPRTFVNLIPPPDVEALAMTKGMPIECGPRLSFNCPCIIGLIYQKYRNRFANIIRKWQELDIEIASMMEFNTSDFQVVAQPLFINFSVPLNQNGLTDFSYLAADCFHFSQKGGALVSNLLWNNILQPVGMKRRTTEKLFAQFNCPNDVAPFLYTNQNSFQKPS